MDASSRLVVAISRQMGAGGAYVGQSLARRLGIRYVDREILQRAAAVLGQQEGDLEAYEERVTTLWDRVAGILSLGAPEAPFVPPALPTIPQDELFAVESRIIREIAAREDAVFVGRGAAWVLSRQPGVIRVYLHAREEWRLEQIEQAYQLPEAEARRALQAVDRQRDRFLHSLFGPDWRSPASYDICVDTSAIGLDPTVEMLVRLATVRRSPEAP